jgi:hypothetical protein
MRKTTKTVEKKPGVKRTTLPSLATIIPVKTAKSAAASKQTDEPAETSAQAKHHKGKRIGITLRMSPERYRKLMEARLDAGGNLHDLIVERAIPFYFDKALGVKF